MERLEHQNRDLELGNQERKVELEKLADRTQALNTSVLAQEKVGALLCLRGRGAPLSL